MRVAIINDTRPTSHYGCLMVMRNLNILLERESVEVAWTWPVSVDWRKYKSQIEKRPKVDVIIVNGEGTIHHAPRRWQAQALVEFADFAKNQLNVPVFLINSTLYKNEASSYSSLKKYDSIYVRDRASHDELQKNGIKNNFVPDMTFAVSSELKLSPTQKVCVVDSVMQTDIPLLKRFSKKNHADYCSMIVSRPSNYSFLKRPRRFLLESIKWLFKDHSRSLCPTEFETFLGGYKLIVTGRYHTVTMCLKNRIPFVALESNTPKISYLLQEVFGNTKRVISAQDLENLNIEEWSEYSGDENLAIDMFLQKAKEANEQMINQIVFQVKK